MSKAKSKKIGKIIKKILCFVIPIALITVGAIFFVKYKKSKDNTKKQAQITYTQDVVTRGEISSDLRATGMLNPANSYDVTSLVSGKIIGCNIEEGNKVDIDEVLYNVDNTTATSDYQKADMAYQKAVKKHNKLLEQVNDLNIKSEYVGMIVEVDVNVGDSVTAGQKVAVVRNSSTMTLTVPFGANDANKFKVGQSASVIMDDTFETLSGTITGINSIQDVLSGNRIAKYVTIDVKNPGAISQSSTATAKVGNVACLESGKFSYKLEKEINSKLDGVVTKIYRYAGSSVSKGDYIITLESESLMDTISDSADALKEMQLSLNDKKEQLEQYIIKSPISGTIIQKTAKLGDKIESGKSLCKIFDLSYLTVTINVDELDILKVKEGQEVSIMSAVDPSQEFHGTVTKININGSGEDGAVSSTYPVTIRIDDYGQLLTGMNVDVSIFIEKKEDVLMVPIAAVTRGNMVLVKDSCLSDEQKENAEKSDYKGFSYVVVETGISSADYIEIVSGLNENDTIAIENEPMSDEYMGEGDY